MQHIFNKSQSIMLTTIKNRLQIAACATSFLLSACGDNIEPAKLQKVLWVCPVTADDTTSSSFNEFYFTDSGVVNIVAVLRGQQPTDNPSAMIKAVYTLKGAELNFYFKQAVDSKTGGAKNLVEDPSKSDFVGKVTKADGAILEFKGKWARTSTDMTLKCAPYAS